MKIIVGSNVQHILAEAPCPVVCVKRDDEDANARALTGKQTVSRKKESRCPPNRPSRAATRSRLGTRVLGAQVFFSGQTLFAGGAGIPAARAQLP